MVERPTVRPGTPAGTGASSTDPLQSLSTPSQTSAPGAPATQLSTTCPPTQLVTPAAPQAPPPHDVGWDTYPSSTDPLQSLSTPSQTSALGVPGAQLSTTCPPTQLVTPAAPQAPTPQDVGCET